MLGAIRIGEQGREDRFQVIEYGSVLKAKDWVSEEEEGMCLDRNKWFA